MDPAHLPVTLLIAHVLGDFYLQPAAWLADRRAQSPRARGWYAYALVHGGLAWLALGAWARWPVALTIGVAHVAVELVRSRWDRDGRSVPWLVGVHAVHAAVALGFACLYTDLAVPPAAVSATAAAWVGLLAALVVARPLGAFVHTFTQRWHVQLGDRTDNLPGAGMWIGIIERMLVLLFVTIGSMEAVGFLLAAKSVFRFGDLRDAGDRKRTEYVLIGTLLSFAAALAVAFATRRLLAGTWLLPK
jgi:hypothetical protein